jgi:probable phosphoglycerate mutase
MTAVVLLLRHGETALNVADALRGLLDIPLTERGRAQAAALGKRVTEEYTVSRLYASPLRRAVETAEHIASRGSLSVWRHEGFIDADYDRWAGRGSAELSDADAERFREWERDPAIPLPGAEPPARVQERAMAALSEVAIDGEVVVVVSHDAVLQLILAAILDLPLESYRGLVQSTATLNEVHRSDGRWRVVQLNSQWHLAEVDTTVSDTSPGGS